MSHNRKDICIRGGHVVGFEVVNLEGEFFWQSYTVLACLNSFRPIQVFVFLSSPLSSITIILEV